MGRKLTIVVTCTDRKSLRPLPSLLARNLRSHTVEERTREWVEAVSEAPAPRSLVDLYQGEAWKTSLRVAQAAQPNFTTRLLVASAGLGLRDSCETGPSYAATFSPGVEDAVADDWSGRKVWWTEIQRGLGSLTLSDLKGPVLLVLSQSYARVLEDEIAHLGRTNHQTILFGGHAEVPGVHRIPADGRLRSALGGTMSGLNQRMAERWLQLLDAPEDLGSERHMEAWARWTREVAREVTYSRARVSDREVLDWIRSERRRTPNLSATSAHRRFRDSGFACEQRRFTSLYRSHGGYA